MYEGASTYYVDTLDNINLFFTAIFIFEAILKIIGYGSTYFQNTQNLFDFLIIFSSTAEITVDYLQ